MKDILVEELAAISPEIHEAAVRVGCIYVAITGEIQKVSNLILNINVYVKELKGGKPEQACSVDIRGDNDVSFDRGLKYFVKNNLPDPQ